MVPCGPYRTQQPKTHCTTHQVHGLGVGRRGKQGILLRRGLLVYWYLLNPSRQATLPSAAPIAMKDVVGYQAKFGNYKKVVLAGSDLMAVVNATSTHCFLVECCDGDVPYTLRASPAPRGGQWGYPNYYVWESHCYSRWAGPKHWGWGTRMDIILAPLGGSGSGGGGGIFCDWSQKT